MRIPLLGISHETNTFSSVPADYDAFVETGILRGSEIIDKFVDAQYTISGYNQAAEELDFELVPLMYAVTGPIGTITKDAYDRLTEEMFGMLRDGGPWDAVLISNHGAAVSEEFPDMDGEFCRAVREIVGPDLRIGCHVRHARQRVEADRRTHRRLRRVAHQSTPRPQGKRPQNS